MLCNPKLRYGKDSVDFVDCGDGLGTPLGDGGI